MIKICHIWEFVKFVYKEYDQNLSYLGICHLELFILNNQNEFFKTNCIFGKLSARAFQKHIVLYSFAIYIKSYSRNIEFQK